MNDRTRQPGQLRHVNAVRAVRPTGHNLVQKHHPTLGLGHRHVVVSHARQHVSQLGQLVVMRRKQGEGFQLGMAVQVLNDCPGNGESVVGAGAAPDFIQYQQAAWGGIVQDVGCFDHFHHKGGLTGMDRVLRADARENAVNQPDLRALRWHKTAQLCH